MVCGACCAFFRVSFYWGESDLSDYGTVPIALTENMNEFLLCMKGTNQKQPRCAALAGEIGNMVACSIYPNRSSTCRDFVVDSAPDSPCSRARAKWGLPPVPNNVESPTKNPTVFPGDQPTVIYPSTP